MKERLQDREISIINLFWAVCLKWRSIIAVGLICALLAGGYSYFKSAKAAATSREALQNPITTEELAETTELSPAGKVYLEYLKQYEEQHQYNTESILMNLNPSRFYKGEISYAIDNHFEVEYPLINKTNPVDNITSAYIGVLNNGELLEEAAKILKLVEDKAGYAGEVIDTKNRFGNVNSVGTLVQQGVISVSVYGRDKEECEKLLDLVQSNIEEAKSKIASDFESHDLIMTEKNVFIASDNYLLQVQRDQLDRLRDFSDRIAAVEKTLTEDDRSYAEAYKIEIKDEILEKDSNDVADESDEAVLKESEDAPHAGISKKLVVAGFVGGMFMMFVLYALLYILGNKLRLEDEVDELFGLSSIGIITSEKRKTKGLDGFLTGRLLRGKRLFERDEALGMAVANIAVMARKSDVNKVYLVGAAYDEKEKDICDKLQKSLKKSNIDLQSGRCILYDAASLEQAAEIGSVVVAARAGVSSLNELAEEMDLCISQKTKILGILVID